MEQNIGEKIKEIRKSRKLTIAELSEMTELSLGFLSNLERNTTSPTIANLHKICNALNITLNDILDIPAAIAAPQEELVTIVRADERKPLFEQDNGGLVYNAITYGKTDVKVTSMTISNEELYPFSPHEHNELGIIIQGSMEMQVENKSYYLYPGDSIYIRSGTMHSAKKLGDEPCISYWVKSTLV